MADLDFPTSPSDGETYAGYVYNAAKGVWQWQVLSPSLVSLTDTDITSPSSGEVLEYDGTNWVNAAGGKILQVVYDTAGTETTVASTTFAEFGLEETITPISTSSKILIIASINAFTERTDTKINDARIRLQRNGVSVAGEKMLHRGYSGIPAGGAYSFVFLESPNSTSALTYTFVGRTGTTSDGGQVTFNYQGNSTMVVLEVAG